MVMSAIAKRSLKSSPRISVRDALLSVIPLRWQTGKPQSPMVSDLCKNRSLLGLLLSEFSTTDCDHKALVSCASLMYAQSYSTLGPVSTWMGDHVRVHLSLVDVIQRIILLD